MKSLKIMMVLSLFWASAACASTITFYGRAGAKISVDEAIAPVRPGDIVVIGEEHGQEGARQGQLLILNALRQRGLNVSVGMEFLEYPFQKSVDEYRQGFLLEPEFLKAVKWGSIPYSFYKDQIEFPDLSLGATTVALNAPRALTAKVSKLGLDSLTADERALLPPGLTRGNDRYYQRFVKAIGHLPSPEAGERYFWAQSIWDETMAWKTLDWTQAHPDQVFVITVGEFHVQYGGGLPDRLRARGAGQVHTFSEINVSGVSEGDVLDLLKPDPQDGWRADVLVTFD